MITYWLFAELPPYGLKKEDFNKPSDFKEAVENLLLNEESFKFAMTAYYCAEDPDCLCDYVDRAAYNFDSIDLPMRLFYSPTGWKGRRTSNPVIVNR